MAYKYPIKVYSPSRVIIVPELVKKVKKFNKVSEKLGKDVEEILDAYSKINFSIEETDNDLNKILERCMSEVERHYMFFINRYSHMKYFYKEKEIVSVFSELIELSYYNKMDGLSQMSQILIDKLNALLPVTKGLFLYMVDLVRITPISEYDMDKRRKLSIYSDRSLLTLIEHIYLDDSALLEELRYGSIGLLSEERIEIAWFTAYYLKHITLNDDSLFFWRLFIIALNMDALKKYKTNLSVAHFAAVNALFFRASQNIDVLEYLGIDDIEDKEIYNVEVIKRKQKEVMDELVKALKKNI